MKVEKFTTCVDGRSQSVQIGEAKTLLPPHGVEELSPGKSKGQCFKNDYYCI